MKEWRRLTIVVLWWGVVALVVAGFVAVVVLAT